MNWNAPHAVALIVGWIVMVMSAASAALFVLWLAMDYAVRWLSRADAWWKVVCELHKRRDFRWQKQRDDEP